jgi:translation elongation factor EF-4
MDTPGHVDFAYEVSRSLAACEGALLVVDAAQGVEAQTLANVYQSIEHDHEIVPVINKIDLPAAEPEKVRSRDRGIIGIDASERGARPRPSRASASRTCWKPSSPSIPPPKGDREAPLKAMLVDSWYDPYLGVVILVRVIDGVLKKGPADQVHDRRHRASGRPRRLHAPKIEQLPEIGPGEIGFITAQIKDSQRRPGRRHHHHGQERRAEAAARVQGSAAGGVLRAVPGRCRRFREAARIHQKAAPQRRQLQLRDGNLARRWASASAAASLACCTSRSFRSA